MKLKYLSAFIALTIILGIVSAVPASAVMFDPPFTINSKAAVMINLDTGDTVFARNENKKMYPASLTKIMTAIIVLDNVTDMENTYFEAPLAVFDDLYLTGALTVGFSRGEKASVKDLMYSMLIYSACESAGILAYNVGGESIPNFVSMMNKKADEIGCVGTHFVNPHGLHDKNQYTNASDLALITKYAIENYPEFTEIACTTEYTLGATNYSPNGWVTITHSNKMTNPSSEYYYPYALGIKTGTTDESGRNLISMAEKNDSRYLLVTMGAPMYDSEENAVYGNFDDHKRLYDWAFDTLSYQQIIAAGQEITEIQVKMGVDKDYVRLVTAEGRSMLWSSDIDVDKLKVTIDTADYTEADKAVTAPIEQGQKFGTYTLSLNGEEIASVDLIAQESISLSHWQYNLDKAKQFFGSFWFKAAFGAAIFLVTVYVLVLVFAGSGKKKKKYKKVRRRKF